jgi:hypothetical protein
MILMGHVAKARGVANKYKILIGERQDGMVWIGWIWLRIGIGGGLL